MLYKSILRVCVCMALITMIALAQEPFRFGERVLRAENPSLLVEDGGNATARHLKGNATAGCDPLNPRNWSEGWDGCDGQFSSALTYWIDPAFAPWQVARIETAIRIWERTVQITLTRTTVQHLPRSIDVQYLPLSTNYIAGAATGPAPQPSWESSGFTEYGDVIINADPSFTWGLTEAWMRAFFNTILHELGHALGLPHHLPSGSQAVMAEFTSYTSLQDADRIDIQFIYPARVGDPPHAAPLAGAPTGVSVVANPTVLNQNFGTQFTLSSSNATAAFISDWADTVSPNGIAGGLYGYGYYYPLITRTYVVSWASSTGSADYAFVRVTVSNGPCFDCTGSGGGNGSLVIQTPSPVTNDQSLTAVLTGTVLGGTLPLTMTWTNPYSASATAGTCSGGSSFTCVVSIGRNTNVVGLRVVDAANAIATKDVTVFGPSGR